MSAASSERSPAACWSLVGPPWPSRLDALQRSSWRHPHDAHASAAPLAEFVIELARQLDPAFPDGLPRPPSRPPLPPDDLAVEPPGGRGLAWKGSYRRGPRSAERRLVFEARGLPGGQALSLTWRDVAAPPGAFRARRELELSVAAPSDARRALETAVEVMLRERPGGAAPPIETPRTRTRTGPLAPGDYLPGAAVLALCLVVGGQLLGRGIAEIARWGHAPHFVAVEGEGVAVQLVARDDAWSETSRLGAELAPEVEVAYELEGRRSIRFVDDTIRRQTPAIVRSLGEQAWLGRPVPLWADPHRPWEALRERPSDALPRLGSLMAGLLLLSVPAFVGGAFVRERLARRRASGPAPTGT
jgi:hypothetical protein